MSTLSLIEGEPRASALIGAIRSGDVDTLRRMLLETPELANATITRPACDDRAAYTYPLIAATTDWPGHFPRVAESIAVLVAAHADVDARTHGGAHRETALHGAASSDDVAALDALLDAGADIEADAAVIADGTPLDDAIAFGQWRAARRLIERGARTAIWHVAALGLMDHIEAWFAAGRPPAAHPWADDVERDDVTVAFWAACHGGQRQAAEYLLARGADPTWRAPWDDTSPQDAARRSRADDVADWVADVIP